MDEQAKRGAQQRPAKDNGLVGLDIVPAANVTSTYNNTYNNINNNTELPNEHAVSACSVPHNNNTNNTNTLHTSSSIVDDYTAHDDPDSMSVDDVRQLVAAVDRGGTTSNQNTGLHTETAVPTCIAPNNNTTHNNNNIYTNTYMVDTSTVQDDSDHMSVEAVHQLVADMGTGGGTSSRVYTLSINDVPCNTSNDLECTLIAEDERRGIG